MGAQCRKANANANASSKGCLPAFINDQLRSLCNDYQEWRHPADPKEGVGRQLARLALLLAVLAVFLLIAVGLFYQQPEVYSTRIPKARFYKDAKDYFEFFPAAGAGEPQVKGLRKLAREKVTAFDCPCRKQSVNWSKFTQFYALQFSVEASGSSSTHNTARLFHDIAAFCRFFSDLYGATTQQDTSSEAKGQLRKPKPNEVQTFHKSCYSRFMFIIGPDPDVDPTTDNCVGFFSTSTNMHNMYNAFAGATNQSACFGMAVQFESNRLMDSEVLNHTVSRRLLDTISRAPSNYFFPDPDSAVRRVPLNATWDTYAEMVFRVYIAILLHLHTGGKQSPQENYHDNSYLFNGTIVSLGMQVNWTKYYEVCDPPWCDVNKVNSKTTMAYTVLVQLGGLLSIATFGVQSLLWPAISNLCFTSAPRPADLSAPAAADLCRSAHLCFTFVPRVLAWRRRATGHGWRTVREDVAMQAKGTS